MGKEKSVSRTIPLFAFSSFIFLEDIRIRQKEFDSFLKILNGSNDRGRVIDEAKEINEADKDEIKKGEIAADGQIDVDDNDEEEEEEEEKEDEEEINMKIKDEGHVDEKEEKITTADNEDNMDESQDDGEEKEIDMAKKRRRRKWWKALLCCPFWKRRSARA